MNDDQELMVMVPLSFLKEKVGLRDWFAGLALQGMLASHSVKDSGEDDVLNFSVISELAYRYAHSMLKERAE